MPETDHAFEEEYQRAQVIVALHAALRSGSFLPPCSPKAIARRKPSVWYPWEPLPSIRAYSTPYSIPIEPLRGIPEGLYDPFKGTPSGSYYPWRVFQRNHKEPLEAHLIPVEPFKGTPKGCRVL